MTRRAGSAPAYRALLHPVVLTVPIVVTGALLLATLLLNDMTQPGGALGLGLLALFWAGLSAGWANSGST